MNIQELKETLNGNDNVVLNKILEIRTYIPIAEKRAIVEDIIDKTSNIDNDFLQIDSIKKKIFFELAMVKYHTNLDIEEEDYDTLYEDLGNGFNIWTLLMPYYEKDYKECTQILRLAIQDLQRQYSIEASVSQMCKKVAEGVLSLSNALVNKTNDFNLKDILPNNTKPEDLQKLFEKYVK